ncbi:MAG: glycosyltransferase family 4 protein [Terriglobales bacterium]
MRILLIADSLIPVPPVGYGGTERIVALLATSLMDRGHHVTVMGGVGTLTGNRVVIYNDRRDQRHVLRAIAKIVFWKRLRDELDKCDLVHSVARLDYIAPALKAALPVVLHFQNPVDTEIDSWIMKRTNLRHALVLVGHAMKSGLRFPAQWKVVHNAIDVSKYLMSEASGTYLAFLGRLTYNKGVHVAIQVARASGIPLVIAGNIGEGEDRKYYEMEVAPQVDGSTIRYVGEVGDNAKCELLGGAQALLMPVQWAEPFGITAVEALACGTPVIALNRGELPSLVSSGETGFVCDSTDEMIAAVRRLPTIDRRRCRLEAERRFDVPRMCDDFENIYRDLLR